MCFGRGHRRDHHRPTGRRMINESFKLEGEIQMVLLQPKAYREIYRNALCVIGLWIMMIGFYFMEGSLDRTVVL